MDPITAALNFATALLHTIDVIIENTPPAQRAEIAAAHAEHVKRMSAFFARIEAHIG